MMPGGYGFCFLPDTQCFAGQGDMALMIWQPVNVPAVVQRDQTRALFSRFPRMGEWRDFFENLKIHFTYAPLRAIPQEAKILKKMIWVSVSAPS